MAAVAAAWVAWAVWTCSTPQQGIRSKESGLRSALFLVRPFRFLCFGSYATIAAVTWSAEKYMHFEDERTRPVRDLLSVLPDIEARLVIDLGCGPGNSTAVLAARFPAAAVRGIDSSADMIASARRRLPQAQFFLGSIEEWTDGGPFDAGTTVLLHATF